MRQRLHLLPVPSEKQDHPAQKTHAGGDPRRGDRLAGHGPQAPRARDRRTPDDEPDRVHPREHQDHLLDHMIIVVKHLQILIQVIMLI